MDAWLSTGIYEHPAKHQAGTFGRVGRSRLEYYFLWSEAHGCPALKILGQKLKKRNRKTTIQIRLTAAEKSLIEAQAKKENYVNVAEFARKTLLDRSAQ
jgi:hypothetical protein